MNNFKLPEKLLLHLNNSFLKREIGSWELKESIDFFGNPLETELGEVFRTLDEIKQETNSLSQDFSKDGYYGEISEYSDQPGYILVHCDINF